MNNKDFKSRERKRHEWGDGGTLYVHYSVYKLKNLNRGHIPAYLQKHKKPEGE